MEKGSTEESRELSRLTRMIRMLSDVLLSWVFWLSFLVAAAISYAFNNLVQNEDYLRLEAEFNETVEDIHSQLLMQMNRYKGTLYEARSIYAALPEERKSQWTGFIQSLNRLEKNPGYTGLAFIENVSGSDLQTFESTHPELEVTSKLQKQNCIITMYSMDKTYPKALGYNLCATSTLEKTLFEAARTGTVTASPPTYLFGQTKGVKAITLSLPVYETEIEPSTEAKRETQLKGWISSPIQIESLLKSLINQEKHLEFQVFQGDPSPENLLFNHLKETEAGASMDLFAVRKFTIDNYTYTIVYVQRNIEASVAYSIPLLFLGLLFSLVAGFLIWSLYTNKRRAEMLAIQISQSLIDTEASMKKLLDTSPGAIYSHTYEQDWKPLFVSDYFSRLTGYAPVDFKCQGDFDEIIYPSDRDMVRHEIALSLQEQQTYDVEYRIVKADGGIIWVMDKGYLEKQDNETFVRGVMFDITKTKQIEKASHQLNNALMHMAEGISLVDRKGTFIEINPAFSKICGWDIQRIPGIQFMVMIHPEDVQDAEMLFQELHQKEKVIGEFRGVRQDESTFYMSLIFVGLYDDSHELTGAYMFARDISERKSSEENLRNAKEEISMAYKTKSEFLATMSHEMRSPLNVIIGYSDMLREELASTSPNLVQDIEAIKGAGSHLLDLVNDIIDISKLETGQSEMLAQIFDVHDLVENVVSGVSSLVSVNHNKLDVVMGANIGVMNSDFTKIRQNLINLIGNAAKFTLKGHIELSIKTSGTNQEWIHFTVTDSGCGISEEKLEEIFTPFASKRSQKKQNKPGTGLGLPIVLKFCELLGGSLHVNSELDKGTTFEMILPRGDVSSLHTSHAAPEGPRVVATSELKTQVYPKHNRTA